MTITNAISHIVFTRLVTTTSLIAKLAACAILVAAVTCVQAAKHDGVDASGSRPLPAVGSASLDSH